MVKWILKLIVGNQNQRRVKKILPLVARINEFYDGLGGLSDDALKAKVAGWKAHLARYDDTVHYYSRRHLEVMEPERIGEILTGWQERLESLGADFPQLATLGETARSEARGGAKESRADFIVEAQAAYTAVREKFPPLRAAYLEEILPEAFAVVKDTARRLCGTSWNVCDHLMDWNMVHFDVQLVGGIGLHRGNIAEMATGEGKTLVATLPVFLNALTGLGVHVVTVNDYLARRDSEWMGHLFNWLGLSVGCIQGGNTQSPDQRREEYGKDITYGTASEFGFDYLRDNGMATTVAGQVQRGHYYALIDEVDSILIDEARTPLIISGPVAQSTQQYDRYKPAVSQLVKKQIGLCNGFANDAKKAVDEGDFETAGQFLFRVKIGQPRHRILLRLMEEPEARRALEKAELYFFQKQKSIQQELFEFKEELYFNMDEKTHDADLTEKGRLVLDPDDPEAFVLPDLATEFSEIDGDESLTVEERTERKRAVEDRLDGQGQRMHSINQLLKAYCLYEKDVDYVVEDNKVIIVDENTGRKMAGRRWSDGLHQAVEAKEGVKIDQETQTLATITIQNYFRMYEKMGGMTGTAETEAAEFRDIYNVDVLIIPTNQPVRRVDGNDKVFKTRREKLSAVIELIRETNIKGQPILLGTASVESSETISRMLKREKIVHNVLNAKHHRQEAEIVQRAGYKGAVTVATNMAGRGTDIKLGEGVAELGGLYVIATERHPSRRIDRQLRGRCARQGDPGETIFYVSFEDDLMRQYGASDRMTRLMDRLKLEEGQELEGGMLTKVIEMAQKKVEERNYLRRKWVLQYDDVMNQQREVVYGYRNEVLQSEDPHHLVLEVIEEAVPVRVAEFLKMETEEGGIDHGALLHWVNTTFPIRMREEDADFANKNQEQTEKFLIEKIRHAYELKMSFEPPQISDEMERYVILKGIDDLWREHLYAMDGLREAIQWRAQGQKDPLVEYKKEAYDMFVSLMDDIKQDVLKNLFLIRSTANPQSLSAFLSRLKQSHPDSADDFFGGAGPARPAPGPGSAFSGGPPAAAGEMEGPQLRLPIKREVPKVGRNENCPCGSGKKYKQCCGKAA